MNATAFGAMAVLLALGIAQETRQALISEPMPDAQPARGLEATVGTANNKAESEPVESLVGIILSRPLFTPSRRPPSVAGGTDGLPRLAGVIIGPASRTAIFATGKSGVTVVAERARAGVYEVHTIEPDEVVVSGPEGERRLHPVYAKNVPAAPKVIQGRNPAEGEGTSAPAH